MGASGFNDLFALHASDEVKHVKLPSGVRILYNHRILSTSIIAIIEVHCNNSDHETCVKAHSIGANVDVGANHLAGRPLGFAVVWAHYTLDDGAPDRHDQMNVQPTRSERYVARTASRVAVGTDWDWLQALTRATFF